MDPNQMIVTMDTTWAVENYMDDNSITATMDAAMTTTMDAALTATYNYSLAQMSSVPDSDECMVSPTFEMDPFAQLSPRSRYASLDYDRTVDLDFMLPLERSNSLTNDAKENAKERRRTQNRFAQRAYRQRKEQAIKDQEKEIEELKLQLAKEKKLNQALARVIDFLKERLKGKPLPQTSLPQP